jgi:hypothetical protein
MATKAKKKKSTKTGAKSYWRVVHITPEGRIAKVEDGLGKRIKGKKKSKAERDRAEPKIRDLLAWNDEERCLYNRAGDCFC